VCEFFLWFFLFKKSHVTGDVTLSNVRESRPSDLIVGYRVGVCVGGWVGGCLSVCLCVLRVRVLVCVRACVRTVMGTGPAFHAAGSHTPCVCVCVCVCVWVCVCMCVCECVCVCMCVCVGTGPAIYAARLGLVSGVVSSSSYDMYPPPHMTCILLLICLRV
jgi:hypothetical protein